MLLCILCLIFIAPHCNVTVILVQHFVITNEPLYCVSYLYAVLLLSINLSPTLYLYSTILIFCGYYIYEVVSDFADVIIPNPPYILSR